MTLQDKSIDFVEEENRDEKRKTFLMCGEKG